MDAIEIHNLEKAYGDLLVLRGLNLRVGVGQVYGLLGPNGVGKSTLIHLLMGFLRPNSGMLRVFGESDLEQVRGRIGYVPERLRYHMRYSAREYMRFLGQFSDMAGPELHQKANDMLEQVGLSEAANRPLGTYSKGMLQRFGIAQALLTDPDLLLVDEPTSGLDPVGQRELLDLLAAVRTRGHTILLCTHHLIEVERLCDRVGVLVKGNIAAEADIAQLKGPAGSISIEVDHLPWEVQAELSRLSSAVQCQSEGVLIRPNDETLQARVLQTLLEHHVAVLALNAQERPLEQFYLRAVSGETTDSPPPSFSNNGPPPPPSPSSAGQPTVRDPLLNELLRNTNDGPGERPPPAGPTQGV
ncbi:MAG: ABC transporter ATP-binding protein [Chloroflexaceae bacterium]|jgi:ABC-2 type transport system ATP-binding protein|nr:ABC transporter ATP-binding protein [Chloroflexaceae bacterium]